MEKNEVIQFFENKFNKKIDKNSNLKVTENNKQFRYKFKDRVFIFSYKFEGSWIKAKSIYYSSIDGIENDKLKLSV